MANTRIETTSFDLTALNCLVRTGFRRTVDATVYDYCGIREGDGYKADERAWDENEAGRWKGSPAPLTIPANLTLVDATEIERDPTTERDTVLRLASATPMVARFALLYREQLQGSPTFAVRVWDAATGDGVAATNVTGSFGHDAATITATLDELADGSYIVGCAITTGTAKHLTEAEYLALVGSSVRPAYRYTQDDVEYFYDYTRNLGVRPSDVAHELNAAREEVEAAGTQQDRAEWIQYATSHESLASEWALRKVVVGAGDFAIGAGVLPGPGAALLKGATGTAHQVTEANRVDFALPFDPLARSVASWCQASDGTVYLGGDRSTPSGPETALWRLESDDTATLLATGPKLSTGLCECGGLQDHAARRVVENHDGTIVVQTLCANFRYDPFSATIETRLAPLPRAADGHPGGRSLVTLGRERVWTTEYFGGRGETDGVAAQFYNTVQRASGEGRSTSGVGTVAHLDGNLAVYHGRVRGIVQDKPFSDDTAEQSVAILTGDGWQLLNGMSGYAASEFRLLRVAQIGKYFLADGKEATSEKPACFVSNGAAIVQAMCTHRLRAISTVLNDSGFETGLAPASLPGEEYPRRLVEIGDPSNGVVIDPPGPGGGDPPIDCEDAQCQLGDFGAGSVWFGEPLRVWGENETLSVVAVVDVTAPAGVGEVRPFTQLFEAKLATNDAVVWARIDSEADVDDLASYTLPVPKLNAPWPLSRPARSSIEFVVVLPADADATEPLRLMPVA